MKAFHGRLVFAALLTLAGCAQAPVMQQIHFGRAIQLEKEAYTSANASLGDLDRDGDLDIVLAKGRHWPLNQLILLNDGVGGFQERYGIDEDADRTYTAALGDLNGDGSLDIVVGNDAPDEKRVYFNDGTGRFHLAGTFGEPHWVTRNVTLADLDGNGLLDLVVANRGGPENLSSNYICLNDGSGRFPAWQELSGESATTIAAADLTGDSFVDLVVPHRDGGQSYIFVNDGAGGFEERHAFGPVQSATRAVVTGDFNGDGRLDVVVGDQAGGAWIYLNRGSVLFEDPIHVGPTTGLVYSLAVADLDANGAADLVLGNRQAPGAVLLNDGTGRNFTLVPFGDDQGAIYGLVIGDVDGDGGLDIIAARSDAPSMLYFGSCPFT